MKYNVNVIAVCVCGHTPVGADIVSAPSFIWPITPVIGQKLTIAKELVIPPNQLVTRLRVRGAPALNSILSYVSFPHARG